LQSVLQKHVMHITGLVLGRSQDVDCVGLEEVDSLQTELETLLAAAAKRMRLLQAEIELLDEWLDKGGSSSGNAGSSSGTGMAGNKDRSLASSTSSQPSSAQSVGEALLKVHNILIAIMTCLTVFCVNCLWLIVVLLI
jgi:hypothetical protein